MLKHPLHVKYPHLQRSPEVERAVRVHEHQTKARLPNDPHDRIEAYMTRLERLFLHPDRTQRKRYLEMVRSRVYDELLLKRENFPESYFKLQQRIARERGQAIEEIPPHIRQQMMNVVIRDQQVSLDAWMDYLISNDAGYPPWFKYFVWNNIIKLSQFDKERGEFKRRTHSTVAPFPEIHREALAKIADLYQRAKTNHPHLQEVAVREAVSKHFPSLYAELMQESLAAAHERGEEIRGEWVRYEQGNGDDALVLFHSLDGKGTGWCTAGQSTAEMQIESGDFYVYYTLDQHEEATQPRIAIRMEYHQLAEIRGILPNQELEPQLQDVLDEKLQDFGQEADVYRKKIKDMKRLTLLERKQAQGEAFTQEETRFLYEIEAPIEGFGYGKDPRLAELLGKRSPLEDVPILFGCTLEEIAWTKEDVCEQTRIYIGQTFPDMFHELASCERVFLEDPHDRKVFPNNEIHRHQVKIGGITKQQLIDELAYKLAYTGSADAINVVESSEFFIETHARVVELVRLSTDTLPSSRKYQYYSYEDVYRQAMKLGLELCPAEVGPQMYLQHDDVHLEQKACLVGMKPIASGIFFLEESFEKDIYLGMQHVPALDMPCDAPYVLFCLPSRQA